MLQKLTARWWRTVACLLLCVAPVGSAVAEGWLGNAPDVNWAAPTATATADLGAISGLAQTEDIQNLNYDCQPQTYRYQFDLLGTMHNGCFSTTAFGSLDVLNSTVRGFGFSGAIPIEAFANQAIVPIPGSAGLATLSPSPTGLSYLHIYDYLIAAAHLQYDSLLEPYLQLPATPNMVLSDSANRPITVNAQTIAYSANGSWMIVESPLRSFLRVNLATFDITPFAPSFTTLAFDLAPHHSHVAITDDGRYAAVQSDEFNTFKVYDLATCTGNVTADLMPLKCQSHDYSSYVASQVPGWHLTRHLRFVNDSLLSFHATGSNGTDNYELAPAGSISNLTDYLALGDSYTSGEGAFNYVTGTDTDNNKCHLSVNSYPYLLTHDVFSDGHSVACSGAVIDDLKSVASGYSGQVHDKIARNKRTNVDSITSEFLPGYIAQWEFAQKYQPRVLTVGIGGNDIGFGDILKACVAPHAGNNTCYSSYEDRKELTNLIDSTYPKWTALYQQLQNIAPNTHIYAIGYPHIAAPNGNCAVNVHLNESEIEFSEQLIDYLNSIIQKAATDSGIAYVDISHALDGHRLCEATGASIAINGLTAGNDKLLVLGDESYHPNALGQELIEQAILHGTHNFKNPAAAQPGSPLAAPTASGNEPLLNAPKTGRSISTLVPDDTITSGSASRGGSLSINIDGLHDGLQSNSTYTVHLHGGATIGTINSDSGGNASGTVTVPGDTDSGNQIIDVTGPGLGGQPVDVTTVVDVGNSNTDNDGDGVPDTQDSCPVVANSGQDMDQDGIDDACDGSLVAASAPIDTGNSSVPPDSAQSPTEYSSITATQLSVASGTSPVASSPKNTLSVVSAQSRPIAGAVLGARTTAPLGQGSKENLAKHLAQARDNIRTIHWLPWAIDVTLGGLLLAILSSLFRQKALKK